jgi:hypothetical protein
MRNMTEFLPWWKGLVKELEEDIEGIESDSQS